MLAAASLGLLVMTVVQALAPAPVEVPDCTAEATTPSLAALAPPGTSVVPVWLEAATAGLLGPGDHVDLVAVTWGAGAGQDYAAYLARRATVLPESLRQDSGGSGGGLLDGLTGGGSEKTMILVAVTPEEAPGLAAAATAGAVAAVLVP